MRNAFSLVELSIVLVILGLLTGGILAGQSLIRAAELRSVGTDLNRYTTAVYAFRDKYFAIPGDFAKASSVWGKDNANCSGDPATAATPGTCNGNGDGAVDQFSEGFRLWQQLALAGLIEGSYTGTAITNNAVLGGNIPRGRLGGTGYQIWNDPFSSQGWTGTGSTATSNAMRFGTWSVEGGNGGDPSRVTRAALACEELWNLDTKYDDGKPGTGAWIAHHNVSFNCMSSSDRTASTYTFATKGPQAMVDFQYLK